MTDDGAYIAYQVVRDGPVDIAWQFDFGGNLDGPIERFRSDGGSPAPSTQG